MLALDCMLGRMFANHVRIDITSRALAEQFGGNHTQYVRASATLKQHVRALETQALKRLAPYFEEHGLIEALH